MREKEKALSAEKNLAAVVRRPPPPPPPPPSPKKKKKKKKKKSSSCPPKKNAALLLLPIFVVPEEEALLLCVCSRRRVSCRRSLSRSLNVSLSTLCSRCSRLFFSSSPSLHQPSGRQKQNKKTSQSLPYLRIASAALMPFLHCLES